MTCSGVGLWRFGVWKCSGVGFWSVGGLEVKLSLQRQDAHREAQQNRFLKVRRLEAQRRRFLEARRVEVKRRL